MRVFILLSMPALTSLSLLAHTQHHVLSLTALLLQRSSLGRPPQLFLFFPFATLCVMPWATLPSATGVRGLNNKWLMNTTAVVMHRRLAEVSSWEAMKSACDSMTSGALTLFLSDDFIMGTYSCSEFYCHIDFSGKQLVIIGNNKVLNAGEDG
jgi:hypothetical protein